ncbi:polyubiquitin-tagged protein recognition complex Npl4 component [Trametes versicolor FP-101664 SS1]|uniref:polyubiquitin-tagged protein recognition complex Npl4 component n=1 Tax=Trametes versicolor (strain FP-101664) TaxID=717944 RepID=UPI000462472F|nr:polyubiquitin-tagged protein recognition complex Npl4 component [Trametes versicolor FP-101664 SS1]EIW64969.1 polyubiquitin-tagged protein recognition complex Npl4 component [Trametes versicolor FP-101664 SS1]
MLLRLRSKDGNFRLEFQPTANISELLAKILETAPDADSSTITISNQPRGNEVLISTLSGQNLQSLGLKHGDLIFVGYKAQAAPEAPAATTSAAAAPTEGQDPSKRPWEGVEEDAVDRYWRSQEGKIPRGRDSRFCKHGANAMCDYCMPLEPYDAAYHTEHSIKHLSYHAYLRKITPKASSSASVTSILPPLNPPSYKVKEPCPTGGHPPWPAGICTACQPSAITLQSQPFRMVDHLEIASPDIIDRFLQAWRLTGLQRFGWLIGHYEPYPDVPMGIKAVVEAIHEPPQEGEIDGLSLGLPWEDEPRIRALAAQAATPLQIVGYIFTDLVPTEEDRTKLKYKRHPQSFFLSSLEVLFAAHVQSANPTPSRSSFTGAFGSRMVTAVLTGTEEGGIDVSAYQVSEQACAMLDADMIEASVDPNIMRVKEEDREEGSARYVPDVFFRYKNEYGLDVQKNAKPCFPLEYLLVNVSHGFPQNPAPVFQSVKYKIENRPGLEDQSIENVLHQLAEIEAYDVHVSAQGGDSQKRQALAKFISDWHLIAFLGTTGLINQNDLQVLIRVATAPHEEKPTVLDEVLQTEGWLTLMTFAREVAPKRPSGATLSSGSHAPMDTDIPPEVFDQIARAEAGGSSSAGGIRICPHCTFENTHGGSDCEVCGLPLA